MDNQTRHRAVFFDLGGTLFEHLPPDLTTANLLANLACANAAPQVIADVYRRHRAQVEREALTTAFYMHRALVAEAFARTQSELGVCDRAAIARFCDAQANSVVAHLKLRDDTRDTLSKLRERGYYTAIVSNIDDDYIVPLLARTRLAGAVDAWISSERARSCKPHAGIFDQALAPTGLHPQQVMFVGDSLQHDVEGAARLGFSTALLTADHTRKRYTQPDIHVETLRELLASAA